MACHRHVLPPGTSRLRTFRMMPNAGSQLTRDRLNCLRALFSFSTLLLLAFGHRATAQEASSITSLDSVTLERTACYGTCPAYRLVLTRTGAVRFVSQNHNDRGRLVRDSIAPQDVAALLPAAVSLGVLQLPPDIAQSPELCPDRATDHPTVTVRLFGSGHIQQIVDYHGCFLRSDHSTASRLDGLRRFEILIDSTAGSKRWVRPNNSR